MTIVVGPDRSPFRAGFCTVSLFIGGAWVAIDLDDLSEDGVTITRAFNEAGQCTFRIKDPTGKWSPRHPASPYFGQIGKGTPVKVETEVITGAVRVSFYGEVTSFQPGWTKAGGKDAYVDVTAAGTRRRIGVGSLPVKSPLHRACSTLGADLVAYWPMEDGTRSAGFAPSVGGRRMPVTGSPNFGAYSAFLGSDPIPTVESAGFVAPVPTYTNLSPAQAQVRFLTRVPTSTTNGDLLLRIIFTGGTIDYVDVTYGTGSGGFVTAKAFNAGSSVGTLSGGTGMGGKALRMSLEFAQSGANITVGISTLEPGAASGLFWSGSYTGRTLGRVSQVWVNPNRETLVDLALGHLTVERAVTSLFTVAGAVLAGYQGETATNRFTRLCAENGISSTLHDASTGAAMGPQTTKTLDELLRECAETDGGYLFEPRSSTELALRALRSLFSQTDVLTIPYVDNLLSPFLPVEDDASTVNVSTVQRAAGSSATVEVTDGPLGTASGIGRYEDSQTLNLATDDQTEHRAGWISHVGTHDEARFPAVGLDFANPNILGDLGLLSAMHTQLDLGVQLEVTGIRTKLPWLPPFDVKVIVTGYTESIKPKSYRVDATCVPARPYKVGIYGSTASRYGLAGTVTAGTMTTTSTSRTMTVPAPGWTHADGDFEIVVDGEVMLVTNVTGSVPTQTFTLVRSRNGVVKTHAAGAVVELYEPTFHGI